MSVPICCPCFNWITRMRNNYSCVVGTGRSLALDSTGHWGRAEQERVQDKNSVEVGNSIRVFIIVWMRVLSYIEITLSAMCCVCVHVCSVTPNSATSGKQPTMLLCPWNFPGKEYWSGLPCPTQGNLPDPGIKPVSPALPGRFSITVPPIFKSARK